LNFGEGEFNDCLAQGPKAYFLTCQLVGRQMAERKSAKIINLATTDARLGSGGTIGSSAAHSSIESMTRAIAQAWATMASTLTPDPWANGIISS
jgi:NAD(P)-dependent dehydrogenase (short-subunit alcohol dehydrogenase family)